MPQGMAHQFNIKEWQTMMVATDQHQICTICSLQLVFLMVVWMYAGLRRAVLVFVEGCAERCTQDGGLVDMLSGRFLSVALMVVSRSSWQAICRVLEHCMEDCTTGGVQSYIQGCIEDLLRVVWGVVMRVALRLALTVKLRVVWRVVCRVVWTVVLSTVLRVYGGLQFEVVLRFVFRVALRLEEGVVLSVDPQYNPQCNPQHPSKRFWGCDEVILTGIALALLPLNPSCMEGCLEGLGGLLSVWGCS